MTFKWFYAIASVVLISLVSLIGILTISMNEDRLRRMIFILVSFAVGGLFGDAFFHLLPEAFGRSEEKMTASFSVLIGIFVFFALEKFLRWRHRHSVSLPSSVEPVGYLNLIADGVHNFIDGMLIGASYLLSIPVGIATTLAVMLHEMPQEIGDFGVLLRAGFSKKRALLFNYATASLAIVGALVTLAVGSEVESFSRLMLPFTAGGFIYIAGSDLLPELHEELDPIKSVGQILAVGAGAGLMWTLTLLE